MTDSASPCTCFHLRRATRRVSQIYDHALAAVDLGVNQYSMLRRLQARPLPLGVLAEQLGMDRTTLNRNLRPLLEAGLLQEARGDDARQRLIDLSSPGRQKLRSALPHWRQAQRTVETLFGASATQSLHGALARLATRAERHLGAAP